LPFEDAVVVIELKGQDIWDALEGGFGSYPNQEGRFPQVGGLSIVWDSRKPPGKRLVEVHLLEDAHLFDSNGLKRDDDGELPKKSSIAFEPSEEGGYSIDVRRPNICKGEKLQMDKIYRVCTREYMADGHDGYDALSRGTALIDHESGALMSTQVRKFLLGASLIWRLKSFQENSDENGKGVVGQNLLSLKTKEAIKRAQALHQDSPNEEGSKENGTSSLNAKITPRKGKKPAPLSGFDKSPRVVIDSSPGGIRDAMHVGASENHSQYDPASRMFKGGTRAPPNTASSLQFSSESPGASPTRGSSYLKRPSVLSPGPSPLQQENGEATPSIISKHFQLGPEDAEVLRHSNGDLAVIAPLIDGRIVDLARLD
jgi:5'-nucleotidase